ncbi:MAG: thymidine phosphorylase [Eubacterium sp.]|nr:thymidine phosphorylase [Eubacterium sp.]
MNIIDIIEKKKRNEKLSVEEIYYFVEGVTNGTIADYQTSALLMAICINGMDYEETFHLTMAMAYSGDMIDMSTVGRTVLDKHSTGGVGDKTTLIVGPLMASLGVPVGKMSGRGLGITGGTIDKLDTIPGFSSDVSIQEFMDYLQNVGFVDAAQTLSLAPADKILYSLRDVTGTVDSIPLIASSIMSKKLASGAGAIVLDVKCGNGAFMKDIKSAELLAKTMIEIGKRANKKMRAVITDMNEPLGFTVGNRLEVEEAVAFLKAELQETGLKRVVISLCTEMYKLSDVYKGESDEMIAEMLDSKLTSGEAYKKFSDFVMMQGGSLDSFENNEARKEKLLAEEKLFKAVITTEDINKTENSDYYLYKNLNADIFGNISLMLGAGRLKKEDEIDPDAGIVFTKKAFDKIEEGDVLMTLYSRDRSRLKEAVSVLKEEISLISYKSEESGSIILSII